MYVRPSRSEHTEHHIKRQPASPQRHAKHQNHNNDATHKTENTTLTKLFLLALSSRFLCYNPTTHATAFLVACNIIPSLFHALAARKFDRWPVYRFDVPDKISVLVENVWRLLAPCDNASKALVAFEMVVERRSSTETTSLAYRACVKLLAIEW